MYSRTDSRKFKTISRRELLKLTPVIALGAFAIPQLQKPLLKGGLGFSDWASARLFRSGHLAPTFADSELPLSISSRLTTTTSMTPKWISTSGLSR